MSNRSGASRAFASFVRSGRVQSFEDEFIDVRSLVQSREAKPAITHCVVDDRAGLLNLRPVLNVAGIPVPMQMTNSRQRPTRRRD